MRSALLLPLTLLLAGCATMSPEECRYANWHDVGWRDGSEGRTLALFNSRVEDCTEGGVRVDGNAYLRGRDEGLKHYCRLENAVAVGLAGDRYEGVCPAPIDAEFRRRHALAYNVYSANAEVARIDDRMQALDRRLHQLDRDEDKRLREAAKDDAKDDNRRRIRRDFDDERRRLRDELRDLDYAAHRARDAARYAEWTLSTLR